MVRMSRVHGRTDDMLVIRGVNVFPSQVEAALLGLRDLSPHYQLVVDRPGTLDVLAVRIEVLDGVFEAVGSRVEGAETSGNHGAVRALEHQAAERLRSVLGLTAQVSLCAPGTLPRSEGGKLKRVDDRRRL